MANMAQAVRMALHYGEKHLGVTDVFGEDVGPPLGGVFTATQGLKTAWNTPLDERGIIGTAMGIAYAGGRPVCEIQFCDYAFNVMDLFKIAGNQRWACGGGFDMPIVVMTPDRGRHSRQHLPLAQLRELGQPPAGWKVVHAVERARRLRPDARGDQGPEPGAGAAAEGAAAGRRTRGSSPASRPTRTNSSRMIDAPIGDRSTGSRSGRTSKEHLVQIGEAELVREGTTARSSATAGRCRCACRPPTNWPRDHGHTFDVIDLRSIFPYDWDLISRSVLKTGRVLIVNEDTEVTNFGEHLLRRVVDEHFYDLTVRPRTLMGKHVPGIGMNQNYEMNSVPQLGDIRDALRDLATEAA